ncbi:HNH endonuclease family protein [Microbacterium sp. GXF7504]
MGTRTVRRLRRRILLLAITAAIAVVAGVLLGWVRSAWPGIGAPTDAVELARALALVDEHAAVPDYRREAFGDAWTDIDGNGCAQRQDVLARDLTGITRDGCVVLTGVLDDPYTGETVEFRHDRVASPGEPGSTAVQIDHVVSLAAAWRGGAHAWTDAERLRFANTLDHLLAVDGAANQGKGSKGPGAWLPPDPSYRCDYADRYTRIAADWDLAVTRDDRAALVGVLTACGATGAGSVDRLGGS